jgi:hypothetical protein
VRATAFEFNHRFWLIGVIFWLGFTLGSVDHVNAAVGLLHLFKPTLSLDGAEGARLVRLIFVSGAVVVFLAALLRTWATAYLRADVVPDFSMHSEKHVADGPFRYGHHDVPAIIGEAFIWLFGGAVLTFAFTLRFKPVAIMLMVSIAVYFVSALARKYLPAETPRSRSRSSPRCRPSESTR